MINYLHNFSPLLQKKRRESYKMARGESLSPVCCPLYSFFWKMAVYKILHQQIHPCAFSTKNPPNIFSPGKVVSAPSCISIPECSCIMFEKFFFPSWFIFSNFNNGRIFLPKERKSWLTKMSQPLEKSLKEERNDKIEEELNNIEEGFALTWNKDDGKPSM